MSKNVREVALDVLLQVEKNQAYSNLLLNEMIKKSKLHEKDIALLTEIIYGTIQRRDTLDFYLYPYTKQAKKLQDWVKILLRMSVYQIVYLNKIPDHAVVHEAVKIGKKRGHRGIAGMVNGILRNLLRHELRSFSEISDPLEQLAVKMSHPLWLVKRWVRQYGMEKAEKMCEQNLKPPHVTVRVNRMKASVEEVRQRLEEEGFSVRDGELSEDGLVIEKGNVAQSQCFKQGFITIQDESSMLVARALNPACGSIVLDCCAAPGGKTTHLAERMGNEGKVIACDLHEHKIKLINENKQRLGLSIIETKVLDARKAREIFPENHFDYILVDAPCSGLGVIRRKPDLKWAKTEQDIAAIVKIQQEILASVAPLLKPNGMLVYSTCTIDRTENEEIIGQFLQNHPFILDDKLQSRMPEKVKEKGRLQNGQLTILPHDFHTDGFYIAAMKKTI